MRDIGGGIEHVMDNSADFEGIKIFKGTQEVVTTTVSGALGFVGSISSSVAGNFSLLTFDKDYLSKRHRKVNNKAKNVLDGLEQGFTSLIEGVSEGVTGTITQPITGARSNGVSGFFKGIGKGLLGLVVKPTNGILDTISKTAEGVKNTVKSEDIVQVRTRRIRPFYGIDQYIKEYKLDDAIFISFLERKNLIKKGPLIDSITNFHITDNSN